MAIYYGLFSDDRVGLFVVELASFGVVSLFVFLAALLPFEAMSVVTQDVTDAASKIDTISTSALFI